MQAFNHTRQRFVSGRGNVAHRPWACMRGLIGHSPLEPGEGLLLLGTKGIHTFGMRFAIDALFLDVDGNAVHLIHSLQPFRFTRLIRNSAMVLELPAGILRETGTQIGDSIEVSGVDGVRMEKEPASTASAGVK